MGTEMATSCDMIIIRKTLEKPKKALDSKNSTMEINSITLSIHLLSATQDHQSFQKTYYKPIELQSNI